MSESDCSEDDIFEYQPLAKQKRKPVLHDEKVKSLRQKAQRKPTVVNHQKSKSERKRKLQKSSLEKSGVVDLGAPSSSGGQHHGNGTQQSQTDVKEGNRLADCLDPNLRTQNANCSSVDTFCPICQMPLSIVIGSRDHHVFQCVQGYDRISFEGGQYFTHGCSRNFKKKNFLRYLCHRYSSIYVYLAIFGSLDQIPAEPQGNVLAIQILLVQ